MAVIVLTFFLFLIALFTKGLTHDLLLEAGVFLVSLTLIIMAYKNARVADSIHSKLDDIHLKLGCGRDDARDSGKDGR